VVTAGDREGVRGAGVLADGVGSEVPAEAAGAGSGEGEGTDARAVVVDAGGDAGTADAAAP